MQPACQPAQQRVPSALCAVAAPAQRQSDPRFPVSVLKVYLTLAVSHQLPLGPSCCFYHLQTRHRAKETVSAAVAASNPRSLFANTLRKSSLTPVIRFVFCFLLLIRHKNTKKNSSDSSRPRVATSTSSSTRNSLSTRLGIHPGALGSPHPQLHRLVHPSKVPAITHRSP